MMLHLEIYYTMENVNKKTENQFVNWDETSKNLTKEFKDLNETDLKYEPGKENDLYTRLQEKLNKSRSEIVDIIKKNQIKTS